MPPTPSREQDPVYSKNNAEEHLDGNVIEYLSVSLAPAPALVIPIRIQSTPEPHGTPHVGTRYPKARTLSTPPAKSIGIPACSNGGSSN